MIPSPDWFRTALTTRVPSLEGWCSVEKALALFDLVMQRTPTVSLELGVWGARSFLPLACGHWCINQGHVLGFDTYRVAESLEGTNDPENAAWWQGVNFDRIRDGAFALMRETVPSVYWKILLNRTVPESYEPSDIPRTQWIDLLHQDSNHSSEVSSAELDYWRPAMRPGALWIMDDANWPTIQPTRRKAEAEYGFRLLADHEQWCVYEVPSA